MTFSCRIDSLVGPLTVVSNESAVTAIRFGDLVSDGAAFVDPPASPTLSATPSALSTTSPTSLPSSVSPTDSASADSLSFDSAWPEVLRQAVRELNEFFAGTRRTFTVPLAPVGTPFQQQVWRALQTIPYGATCSYRDIACAVGRPAACRAVGMANHCNPIPIIIPCHRVVGADGRLTGYAGGLAIKSRLLQLERENCGESLLPF